MTGKVLGILLLVCAVSADINLHNPRGGNNRLDEERRDRKNANRLFDSQNNNRGGHNVGKLYYYTGSHLQIQWANQHSCNDRNNHCELVLQYMCGDLVRDGTTTEMIPENNQGCYNGSCNTDLRLGMHEDNDYYNECKNRERNKGLFIADRNLRNRDTAKYTRQNNNGQRRGYECPEERDYYPYWHPTPWRDIAVLTNNASRREMYRRESENVRGRYKCVLPEELKKTQPNFRIPNNKVACEAVKYPNTDQGTPARWVRMSSHRLPAPDCKQSIWSRDNHQGNVEGGEFMSYDWVVPNTPHEQCVFRIRYNITAGEYDGWDPAVNSALNGRRIYYNTKYNLPITDREARNRGYYYRNDPDVKIFKDVPGFRLRIQINTNQDARTFQDRSHTFAIRRRPGRLRRAHIHNVNVRGKRGNIVQVFPSTEYDFVPNTLTMTEGHYVHFQWTGSNSNPNNNAGEGRRGSDRHNVLPLADPVYSEGVSHAYTYGHLGRNYPKNIKDAVFLGFSLADKTSLAILSPQHFGGENQQLDDAGPYFDLGPRAVKGKGTYYYMSTRNNNFTNRSQKGKIVVI
ncbi:protein DD3-3-like [Actinia tenebrosa]|uniref:Protein DD3-3-like n=1 Tax=Actinia tenebrosa TaxID=6105 RepID=A0A6P8HAJ8_ACTTE|nr:protein DD3-3-like [Actinia tenebrosa]